MGFHISPNLHICYAYNSTLFRKPMSNVTENVHIPPFMGAQLKKPDHMLALKTTPYLWKIEHWTQVRRFIDFIDALYQRQILNVNVKLTFCSLVTSVFILISASLHWIVTSRPVRHSACSLLKPVTNEIQKRSFSGPQLRELQSF